MLLCYHQLKINRKREKENRMKKILTVVLTAFAATLLAALVLTGCGNSENNSSRKTGDPLSGTSWKLVSVETEDGEISIEDYKKHIGADTGDMILIFSENKVESKIGRELVHDYVYTYENGELTIGNKYTGSFEDGRMMLRSESETIILEKQ